MLVTSVVGILSIAQAVHAYDYRPYAEWVGNRMSSSTQSKLFLAFGLRYGDVGCVPAFEDRLTTDMVGQDLILSFGGEAGTYVNQGCKNARTLALNLVEIVDKVKPTGLDFDLEAAGGHCSSLDTLAIAVGLVKYMRPQLIVGVTIAANEKGIVLNVARDGECTGQSVLSTFSRVGAVLDFINIMNMYLDTPDSQITTDTYLTVINKSLETIHQVPGYANWPLSKLGVTFTNAGGNGKLDANRTQDLVARLPQELPFVSMWQYSNREWSDSEQLSQIFRSAAKTQFGSQGNGTVSFGFGEPLSFNFVDMNGTTIVSDGGPRKGQ